MGRLRFYRGTFLQFCEGHHGRHGTDYDVYSQSNTPDSGSSVVYDAMIGLNAATTDEIYEQFKQYLDVTEYIDYVLVHF